MALHEFIEEMTRNTDTVQEKVLPRRQLLYSLMMQVMNLCMPGLDKGEGLYFLFVKSEAKTPGGLIARPVQTSYYKSNHLKSPNEAVLSSAGPETSHLHVQR